MFQSYLPFLALISALCFILALKGLAHPKTAQRGNTFAMVGMGLAIGTIFLSLGTSVANIIPLAVALVAGAVIGIPVAGRIALTALPQLVALFHSFVGLAATLIAVVTYLQEYPIGGLLPKTATELALGAAIGILTFTGSILAALKLQGTIGGKPLAFKGRHVVNLALGLIIVAASVHFVMTFSALSLTIVIIAAAILGFTLVAAIGGADMPVVVSMLNSYSGWAAAATGFMLEMPLLIITGALIGASGGILSYIMCKAMNRSFISVILGGFGNNESASAATPTNAEGKTPALAAAEDAAFLMQNASRVIIVPGYGMAVAQAQHAVKELYQTLSNQGVEVIFAIHPVAGRMPGHMNVLLAEADIPYDVVEEQDEVNPSFPTTDVTLIVGANDVVNPAAQTQPSSPLYGMPILEAHKSRFVYVIKRSFKPGYAGVENELFTMPNCALILGDAKDVIENLTRALKE
ncbi:MAG: NAD synthetase [Alphaproteobacteria bacterium CG_4_10_14_0_8_um_filter_53_9]|nr:MAG: NAD synthetase [Alphaproteobacteria bacterium CG_4_10_14_0_8_um_filter_53_9]